MYKIVLFVAIACSLGYGQSHSNLEESKPNALVNESSPYLLQHAYNPVDWVPWGEEALQKATDENKLVVISIGYSSCHWCQVMEEESFEDVEVANVMNENYISIKVDREEHPDVDQLYMDFLGLIGSDQGWPINIIALPSGKPFYGGTYHTKQKWLDVLGKLASVYEQNPSKLDEYAEKVTVAMQELSNLGSVTTEAPAKEALLSGIENWKKNWDLVSGGELGVEKRMFPSNLVFLMEYGVMANDSSALKHAKNTLDHIARGGLNDHVGGGFFRYTTDSNWQTPHFEKMLYDNAQALGLFSYAYKIFKDPLYEQIVSDTYHFLILEMRNPNGAFYSSINADTDGEEGKFYLWSLEELKNAVPEQFDLFSNYYTLAELDNSSTDHILLNLLQNAKDVDGLGQLWKQQLFKEREKKVRPKIDDKILVSWNSLLVTGMVEAYKTFKNEAYLATAKEVVEFISSKCFENGKLIHSYTARGSNIGGFIEDYAYFTKALLDLYGVTFEEKYLEMATLLSKETLEEYSDDSSSMFNYNSSNKLVAKVIKTNDGVLPSPNAVMAENLFSLGNIYYDMDFLNRSENMLQLMVEPYRTYPQHYAKWGSLFLKTVYPFFEVAVVGPQARDIVQQLFALKQPNILVLGTSNESKIPLFEGRYVAGSTYIYVCQKGSCKLPVTTLEGALEQLKTY